MKSYREIYEEKQKQIERERAERYGAIFGMGNCPEHGEYNPNIVGEECPECELEHRLDYLFHKNENGARTMATNANSNGSKQLIDALKPIFNEKGRCVEHGPWDWTRLKECSKCKEEREKRAKTAAELATALLHRT